MSSNPYIGQITLFAGNYEPVGWFFCQGQLLQISQYDALFSILGTLYGSEHFMVGTDEPHLLYPIFEGVFLLVLVRGLVLTIIVKVRKVELKLFPSM